MSERSIYLRDQADKCLWHASHISDSETEGELRKLATEYIERAAEIEGAENIAISAPPILWPVSGAARQDTFASLGKQ